MKIRGLVVNVQDWVLPSAHCKALRGWIQLVMISKSKMPSIKYRIKWLIYWIIESNHMGHNCSLLFKGYELRAPNIDAFKNGRSLRNCWPLLIQFYGLPERAQDRFILFTGTYTAEEKNKIKQTKRVPNDSTRPILSIQLSIDRHYTNNCNLFIDLEINCLDYLVLNMQ